MKLLFDQNISYKVVRRIQDIFPECSHISKIGLHNSSDIAIWNFAKENNYCIITFDYDFIDFSILKGAPPKIIIIKKGNTKTENLASFIITYKNQIEDFLNKDFESSFLELL